MSDISGGKIRIQLWEPTRLLVEVDDKRGEEPLTLCKAALEAVRKEGEK